MARRIINILNSKPNILPKNIIAFTKKIAEEMKRRINTYGKAMSGHAKGKEKTDGPFAYKTELNKLLLFVPWNIMI